MASAQLKILYLCGLIRFRREKNKVFYRAEADGRMKGAVELLDSLRESHRKTADIAKVIHQVTSFTHERRIEIVLALREGACSFRQLQDKCRMTSSALSRHLNKLEARGIVRQDQNMYCTEHSLGPIGSALVEVICGKDEQ